MSIIDFNKEEIERVTSTDNRISIALGKRSRLASSSFVCERSGCRGDGCIPGVISTLCDISCINYYVEKD